MGSVKSLHTIGKCHKSTLKWTTGKFLDFRKSKGHKLQNLKEKKLKNNGSIVCSTFSPKSISSSKQRNSQSFCRIFHRGRPTKIERNHLLQGLWCQVLLSVSNPKKWSEKNKPQKVWVISRQHWLERSWSHLSTKTAHLKTILVKFVWCYRKRNRLWCKD
mgnify:CR=1 FL=1